VSRYRIDAESGSSVSCLIFNEAPPPWIDHPRVARLNLSPPERWAGATGWVRAAIVPGQTALLILIPCGLRLSVEIVA
jgi:hypothetical protein